jgi:hypothetical protein
MTNHLEEMPNHNHHARAYWEVVLEGGRSMDNSMDFCKVGDNCMYLSSDRVRSERVR